MFESSGWRIGQFGRAHAVLHEALDTLTVIGLADVDAAFRVDPDAVSTDELAHLMPFRAETRDDLQRLPRKLPKAIVLAIGHVQESLLWIG